MESQRDRSLNNHSLDDILANIESQYQQQENHANSSSMNSNSSSNNQQSIDNYFSELQQIKLKQSRSSSPQKKVENRRKADTELQDLEQQFKKNKSRSKQELDPPSDNLFGDVIGDFNQKKSKSHQKSVTKNNLTAESLTNLVENFKRKKERIKQEQRSDNLEEIKQRELENQRKRKLLTRQAERWLKNLDPYSDEGFWFEEFAHSYPSKLEAAIEYLEALQ